MDCYFPMREGVISNRNRNAFILSFNMNGTTQEAIGIRSICYLPDLTTSRNLEEDFYIGDKLHFCAILDSNSPFPLKWKIICAWEDRKSLSSYSRDDWDEEVFNLYIKYQHTYRDLVSSQVDLDETDVNYFPMRHGTITKSNRNALILNFNMDDTDQEAVCIKSVCYLDDLTTSRNLETDFNIGDRLKFSAILDSESPCPEKWKVISAWESYKSPSSYGEEDWNDTVSKLYIKFKRTYIGLCGYDSDLDQQCTSNINSIERDLNFEIRGIEHLLKEFDFEHSNGNVYHMNDDDLDELMSNAAHSFRNYIKSHFESVNSFVQYHSEVFFNAKGKIKPKRVNCRKVNTYLNQILPQLIEEHNIQLRKPNLSSSELGDSKNNSAKDEEGIGCKKKTVVRNIELEKKCVIFFRRELKGKLSGATDHTEYNTTDEDLNNLLSEASNQVNIYLKEMYPTIKDFFKYHSEVFSIAGQGKGKIFPRANADKLKSYVNDVLPQKCKNDQTENSRCLSICSDNASNPRDNLGFGSSGDASRGASICVNPSVVTAASNQASASKFCIEDSINPPAKNNRNCNSSSASDELADRVYPFFGKVVATNPSSTHPLNRIDGASSKFSSERSDVSSNNLAAKNVNNYETFVASHELATRVPSSSAKVIASVLNANYPLGASSKHRDASVQTLSTGPVMSLCHYNNDIC